MDAVVNPEAAGPIKAIGAMKQPDKVTPRAIIKNSLLIIESPICKKILYFLANKQKEQINQFKHNLELKLFF